MLIDVMIVAQSSTTSSICYWERVCNQGMLLPIQCIDWFTGTIVRKSTCSHRYHDHGQYVAEPLPGLGSCIRTSDRAGVIAASSPGQATPIFSTQENGIVHAIIFSRHISIYQTLQSIISQRLNIFIVSFTSSSNVQQNQ